MSAWLEPLRKALDRSEQPTTWFFRDDDAGWADQHLYELLGCFTEFRVPVDLAVIPTQLNDELADTLLERHRRRPALLGLHQHGYSHTNHESTGRKSEFGASRSLSQQREDIEQGAALLSAKLGVVLDPIFTPPWNRCTAATLMALRSVGVRALSRDVTAAPLETGDMVQLPVCVDWSKYQDGEAIDPAALGTRLAETTDSSVVGVMLHHAVMGPAELISGHPQVKCLPMRALLN
jgi:hypothetical protein